MLNKIILKKHLSAMIGQLETIVKQIYFLSILSIYVLFSRLKINYEHGYTVFQAESYAPFFRLYLSYIFPFAMIQA